MQTTDTPSDNNTLDERANRIRSRIAATQRSLDTAWDELIALKELFKSGGEPQWLIDFAGELKGNYTMFGFKPKSEI